MPLCVCAHCALHRLCRASSGVTVLESGIVGCSVGVGRWAVPLRVAALWQWLQGAGLGERWAVADCGLRNGRVDWTERYVRLVHKHTAQADNC